MRVLQLGVGSVGEVNARVAVREPAVETIVLADVDEERLTRVAALLPGRRVETRVVDVSDQGALADAVGDVDFVLNALPPRYDLEIMAACLEGDSHYLDMATGGPREVTGTADLDEQFALDEEFKRRDLAALVSFGIDPGASDVFARALYDDFDTVESLRVLDGDNGVIEGYDLACSFSPETMIEECLLPPLVYRHGAFVRNEPVSDSFEFEFPDPVGRLRVWNVDHEEAQLMPAYLAGKGLRHADFHIALPDEFVDMLRVFHRVGLNRRAPVDAGGVWVSPLDVVVALFPKPVELAGRISGSVCVGTLCTGTVAGRRTARYMHQITSHDEVWRLYGVQGTGYQTGAAAACAVTLFARGEVPQRGVVPPEALSPRPFIAEMERHGLPVGVVELEPGSLPAL
jgi:saccharopine dehydrogenase (NAD+, L-lysine forming)